MNKLFKIFTFVFALSFIIGMNVNAQDAISLNPNSLPIHSNNDFGVNCSGGHIHDDGVAENGYGWNPSAGNPSGFATKFVPTTYPYKFTKFCVAWTRVASGPANHTFTIYQWQSVGGLPGPVMDSIVVTAVGVPTWTTVTIFDFDLPSTWAQVTSGDVYIGVMWNPVTVSGIYVGADQSTTTPLWPGYAKTATAAWAPIQTFFSGYRALLTRAEGGPAGGGVFFDDFEAYTVGQRLACQDSINWTTWSYAPCSTTEDPLISNVQAFSPTKSVVIVQNNDLVKLLGNDTTGIHLIRFKFYVPTSKAGYFNTLAGFMPINPNKWAMECYFDLASTGNNGRLVANSLTTPFAYTHNAWQEVLLMVNLDIDSAMFFINKTHILSWRWTAGASGVVPKRLAANDFFGATASDQMYVDDYWYNPDTSWFLTGVTQNGSNIPTEFALSQNYPNPFNPTTNIKFDIPEQGFVSLKVYDVVGKEIATLVNNVKSAGSYSVDFNGSNLSSGVYFYRLEAGSFTAVKRMILVK